MLSAIAVLQDESGVWLLDFRASLRANYIEMYCQFASHSLANLRQSLPSKSPGSDAESPEV
jgi:hypothetical protein